MMDSKALKWLKDLLYNENIEEVKDIITNMDNSVFLHIFAANYNWDNGFEIPNIIISNCSCDLGTALMMFYNADGYRFLESDVNTPDTSLIKWKEFLSVLYDKIANRVFKLQSICYAPQISKVQAFKLKKNNPNIPNVFLVRSPGIEVEIPIL